MLKINREFYPYFSLAILNPDLKTLKSPMLYLRSSAFIGG